MDITAIAHAIENAGTRGLSHFGVRVQDTPVNVGDALANSRQFGDCWGGEELEGCSTIALQWDYWDAEEDAEEIEEAVETAIKRASEFGDGHMYLIAGSGSYEGTEANERVIHNPEVIFDLGSVL